MNEEISGCHSVCSPCEKFEIPYLGVFCIVKCVHTREWQKKPGTKERMWGKRAIECLHKHNFHEIFPKHKHILCKSSSVIATDEKLFFSLFSFSFSPKAFGKCFIRQSTSSGNEMIQKKEKLETQTPLLFISISSLEASVISLAFFHRFCLFSVCLCVFVMVGWVRGPRNISTIEQMPMLVAAQQTSLFSGAYSHSIPSVPFTSIEWRGFLRSLFLFPFLFDETKNEGGMGGECWIREIFWEQDLNWRESMSMREKRRAKK